MRQAIAARVFLWSQSARPTNCESGRAPPREYALAWYRDFRWLSSSAWLIRIIRSTSLSASVSFEASWHRMRQSSDPFVSFKVPPERWEPHAPVYEASFLPCDFRLSRALKPLLLRGLGRPCNSDGNCHYEKSAVGRCEMTCSKSHGAVLAARCRRRSASRRLTALAPL